MHPAVGRALDGRVHRRLDDRPAQHARHAAADRIRPRRTRSRIATPFGRIDWATLRRLDFEPPDTATFRCLALAYAAGRAGGTAPAWLSAANEVAVEAFLAGLISWTQIADVCSCSPRAHDGAIADTVDDVIAADAEARRRANDFIEHADST